MPTLRSAIGHSTALLLGWAALCSVQAAEPVRLHVVQQSVGATAALVSQVTGITVSVEGDTERVLQDVRLDGSGVNLLRDFATAMNGKLFYNGQIATITSGGTLNRVLPVGSLPDDVVEGIPPMLYAAYPPEAVQFDRNTRLLILRGPQPFLEAIERAIKEAKIARSSDSLTIIKFGVETR